MHDYRVLLREEFAKRNGRNAGYSLRAFARDLAISPAFLSLVLGGRKRLSEERAHTIAERLRWDRSKMVHEWLWDYTTDVQSVRWANQLIHSDQLDTLSPTDFQKSLTNIGLNLPSAVH